MVLLAQALCGDLGRAEVLRYFCVLLPKAAGGSDLGAKLPPYGHFLSSLLCSGKKQQLQDSSQKYPMP